MYLFLHFSDIRKRTRWILNNSRLGNYCKSPKVTANDLISTRRLGDPYFEVQDDDIGINDDDEFLGDFDNDDYGLEDFESAEEGEDHPRKKKDKVDESFNASEEGGVEEEQQ